MINYLQDGKRQRPRLKLQLRQESPSQRTSVSRCNVNPAQQNAKIYSYAEITPASDTGPFVECQYGVIVSNAFNVMCSSTCQRRHQDFVILILNARHSLLLSLLRPAHPTKTWLKFYGPRLVDYEKFKFIEF